MLMATAALDLLAPLLPLFSLEEPALLMAAEAGTMPEEFMLSLCGAWATITVLQTARRRKKSWTAVD